jgi:alpha-galactosidase
MNTRIHVGVLLLSMLLTPRLFAAVAPTDGEMKLARQWAADFFEGASDKAKPFFSFNYGGKPSSEFLGSWDVKRSRSLVRGRTERTITYTDPKTGLQIRCVTVEYPDFPTVEWTLYFKNTGKEDTPILSHIEALDTRIGVGGDEKFVLHHNNGTTVTASDFQPLVTELPAGKQLTLTPNGGRPSGGIWPYFNLQRGDKGRIIAVGWPGKWAITFDHKSGSGLRVTAGQELVHLKLHPGEEIRTPLIVQQFYQDDITRAQNLWRRWMVAYNLPRPGGKLPAPQMTPCSSHLYAEMTKADEASQTYMIDRYLEERIKIDYWWMDAGWYPCRGEWPNTGTWEVDKTRFPRGLRAVSDHAHPKGVKIIVWFEPERVAPGTWLYDNHKDWLLGGTLLNLGNPEALKWLTNHISETITEQGIDLYRQDYNIDPLPFWRNNDAADRQGITENKYVTGYLAYWDALRQRHPNMLIDSCASGGHRNDLETMRRAVPLLRSDYIFEPIGQQGHTYGLAQWLPYFGTGEIAIDPYLFRSCMCAGNIPCWDMRKKDLNYDLLRKLTGEWRSVAANYLGDYYPLTPYSLDKNAWIAWQFDTPEAGTGLVQAFRRDDCPDATKTFRLQGLDADATYEVTDVDVGTPSQVSGKDLMEKGLAVEIKSKPAAAVIRYQKMK